MGIYVQETLKRVRDRAIDLVITSKNDHRLKSVIRATKLARKSPVSTLIVPRGCRPSISKILVAADGSEPSMRAAEAGLYLANTLCLQHLALVRVFSVSYSYVKTGYGVESENFSEWNREIVENSIKRFVSRLETKGLEISTFVREERDVADGVKTILERIEADLLVVGARGKSFIPSYSLGSTTEEIIFSSQYPVLVVKSSDAQD